MKLRIPNKETLIFFGGIVAIVVCIVAQCISLSNTKKKIENSESEVAVYNTYETVTEKPIINKAIYRLCECGGKIGIYDANSDVIIDIIDIFVSTLPKKDRAALKEGIEIYSFNELANLINDFST